jgi:hypothetical protein
VGNANANDNVTDDVLLFQDFLDLLQGRELRALLAGGGSSCVEHLRAGAEYSQPVQEADLHVEVRQATGPLSLSIIV